MGIIELQKAKLRGTVPISKERCVNLTVVRDNGIKDLLCGFNAHLMEDNKWGNTQGILLFCPAQQSAINPYFNVAVLCNIQTENLTEPM